MDSVTVAFSIMGALGSLGGIFAALAGWVVLTREQRAELKRYLKAMWSHSIKALAVLMALLTSGANAWEVYLFGTANTPATRGEILFLILCVWNSAVYFFSGMVFFAFWIKEIREKEYPVHAQT